MPFTLGITGGIGCGKTAATDHLQQLGIDVVDADVIARQVVTANSPALQKIAAHFGDDIIQHNGELNREALRHRIFNHSSEKQWLENLLHPIIRQELLSQLAQAQSPYAILSAPLLLENKLDNIVDKVLVIDCDPAIQIERVRLRDHSLPADIQNIIDQQIPRDQRLAQADDIIGNNGSIAELHEALDDYHQQLMSALV